MLVRLLYSSRAVEPIGQELIDSILMRSRSYNLDHAITGVLCVCKTENVFMQVLEGGRAEVNRLYGTILRDERHEDVVLLSYEEITERHFANWRMGRIDLEKVNRSTILRYAENVTLDPSVLSGQAALALMMELTDSAAIVSRDDS